VGHLQLSVGQRDGLLEKLDGALQVAALHLERAERLVGELALLVDLDGALDQLGRLVDVAAPLQLDEAAVNEDVGVGRVGLRGPSRSTSRLSRTAVGRSEPGKKPLLICLGKLTNRILLTIFYKIGPKTKRQFL